MRFAAAFGFACAFPCVALSTASARAEWRPPDVHATTATLAQAHAAYDGATDAGEARYDERRERWTYRNRGAAYPVRVAVKGSEFRATVRLPVGTYDGGRSAGVRWRADANGITHATLADLQGDAVDRLPQSVFAFAWKDCELAGESSQPVPAWVVVDRAPRDKPHWFYVDKAGGTIVRETTREGKRTVVTSFDRFERVGGSRRARHWTVRDGDAGNDLDVTVDGAEAARVGEDEVAIPQTKRVFRPQGTPAGDVVVLPATFDANRTITVAATVAGTPARMILDTGTASISLERGYAGLPSVLEHARVPRIAVGGVALDDVAVLSIPMGLGPSVAGILGYDFFAGHVVHVDYARERVEVLTPEAAEPAFHAARTTVLDAYVDEGLPLVSAAFGNAAGTRFALDTGSPHLFVLAPFEHRYAGEIAARWSPGVFAWNGGRRTSVEGYLEGSIVVSARQASAFVLGAARFSDITVGVEEANPRADALDIPLDGIVGTDEMHLFEWWFDYDNGRIAVRRSG